MQKIAIKEKILALKSILTQYFSKEELSSFKFVLEEIIQGIIDSKSNFDSFGSRC